MSSHNLVMALPRIVVASAIVCLAAACGNDEPTQAASEEREAPRMIERTAPSETKVSETATTDRRDDFRVVPDVGGQLEQDGMGLETIIDASSKQAYAESLRWIAEDVSPAQFQRLERAIRYIAAYDSAVLGSEERLLQYIDGKTGQELIERANTLIAERAGR